MKSAAIEKKIKKGLAKQGVVIKSRSKAAKGIRNVAKAGEAIASATEQAVDSVRTVAEKVRQSIHEATKP